MNNSVEKKLDMLSRFFLYVLIFWVPYSKAVIESCVVTALFLWIIKRGYLFWQESQKGKRNLLVVFRNSFSPKSCFLNKPIAVFLFFGILSTAVNSGSDFLLRGFLAKTCEWFIIFWLFLEVFTEKKHIWVALGLVIFTSFLTGIDSLLQFYWLGYDVVFHHSLDDKGFATAAFDYANSLAGYLTIVVPLLFSVCFYYRKDNIKFPFAIGMFLVTIWSVGLTFSRSAWMSLLFSFAFFLFIARKRKILVFYFLLVLMFCIVFFMGVSKQISPASKLNWDHIQSMAQWRVGIWQDSFKMIKKKPLLGHGPNTYMGKFPSYRTKLNDRYDYDPVYAHNGYIQLWAELGFFGVTSFIWIIFAVFKRGARVIRSSMDDNNKDSIILVGLLSGCGAFLVHTFFDNNLYSLQLSAHLWIMVGLLVAFLKIFRENRSESIQAMKSEGKK